MFPIHLQGSIAIAGAGVQWLRDNLGIIGETSDVGKPFGFNLPRRLFGNVLIFILYAFVDRILRFKVFVFFFFKYIQFIIHSLALYRSFVSKIDSLSFLESVASSVEDNGGCYFVPAFSGLFCPHWQTTARGWVLPVLRALRFVDRDLSTFLFHK